MIKVSLSLYYSFSLRNEMNILDTRPNVTIEIRKLQSRNTISRVRLNYSLNDTMDRYFVIWWRGIIRRGLPDRLYVSLDHWIFWLRGKLLPTVLKINTDILFLVCLPTIAAGVAACFPSARFASLSFVDFHWVRQRIGSHPPHENYSLNSTLYVSFFNKTLS